MNSALNSKHCWAITGELYTCLVNSSTKMYCKNEKWTGKKYGKFMVRYYRKSSGPRKKLKQSSEHYIHTKGMGFLMSTCAGFGWGRDYFLHSS